MRPRRGSVPGLPKRLRERREALGWSLEDVAAEVRERGMKMSWCNVSTYERDVVTPSPDKLVALSDVLECSVDWLLKGYLLASRA